MEKSTQWAIIALIVIIFIIVFITVFMRNRKKSSKNKNNSDGSLGQGNKNIVVNPVKPDADSDVDACKAALPDAQCDDPSDCTQQNYWCSGKGLLNFGTYDENGSSDADPCPSGKAALVASDCGNWKPFPYNNVTIMDAEQACDTTEIDCKIDPPLVGVGNTQFTHYCAPKDQSYSPQCGN